LTVIGELLRPTRVATKFTLC